MESNTPLITDGFLYCYELFMANILFGIHLIGIKIQEDIPFANQNMQGKLNEFYFKYIVCLNIQKV